MSAIRPGLPSISGSSREIPLRISPISALAHRTRTATPTSGQAAESAGESSPRSAVAVFDSLKNIFHQPPGGKSKLPSFFTAYAAEYQKQEAERSSRDGGLEKVRKEITERIETAREVKLQAEREIEKAKLVRDDFESKMVPLYQTLKDTSIKKQRLLRRAGFELEHIRDAERKLREMQQVDFEGVGQDVIDTHVLHPYQNFMRKYGDLLKVCG
jgi:hypothetical protein